MNNTIIDAHERAQALDVNQSFIVQAPAGSGKTELLIQRILSLLAHACDEPEQIIAITFTRKAAAEMRKRLVSALESAQNHPEPAENHAKTTWKLARAVLDVDARRTWHLLENPNRLRLQTIDSLCANIARSAPFLSQMGAEPQILKNPRLAYEEATRALVKQLSDSTPWQSALTRLFLHLDNNWYAVQRLLTNMLASRDQWLEHLLSQTDLSSKRSILEKSLENVITDSLKFVQLEFPQHCQTELLSLLQSAATVLSQSNAEKNPYANFLSIDEFPGTTIEDQALWETMANFLLTQSGEWRRSFTVAQGFLAPSGTKMASERAERECIKERVANLMAELNNYPALLQGLVEIQNLPTPQYTDEQWQILADLVILLPILAAELQLVFIKEGGVDFIEVASRARLALGLNDSPSELALNWDYRLKHLLVDEFQDTSTPQFHLLEQLTAGWQPDDGRTLFLVGDPMQSIYRFREAEVGLFLRAQLHGLGTVPLKSLQLQVNFRSEPRIIEWINQTFMSIFPFQDEMSAGAVSYSLSHSASQSNEGLVSIHPLINGTPETEAKCILSIIQEAQSENPEASIAILVRARDHAADLFPVLQAANIKYQAHDMERLAHRAVIQDCFALTRALLHPADRIAWLAILRAPWSGLSLNDLWYLTQAAQSGTLWSVLTTFENIVELSEEAKIRLAHSVPILATALAQRGRLPLAQWVQSTWQQLSGPLCIKNNVDFQNTERYFRLLEAFPASTIYDFDSLEKQLNDCFASVDPEAKDRVQIMTMHKAKGLEFDCVILPRLERSASTDKQELLLWWERPRPSGETDLILAPIKSSTESFDPIYQYLRTQENLKSQYENTRVLYVAATRAKKALHIMANLPIKNENALSSPASGSFLSLLWPHLEANFQAALQTNNSNSPQTTVVQHKISRLPIHYFIR